MSTDNSASEMSQPSCMVLNLERVATGGQVNVHPVAHGKDARDKLMSLITMAKSEDKLAPVTVIMPTRSAVAELRRYCAAQGKGIAAVHFTTLQDLAHQWVLPEMAAAGRHVANDTVIGAAVRQVLCDRGGKFAEVADHPSTQREFTRVYKELRGLTDEAQAALGEASERAKELVGISSNVTEVLEKRHYDDRHALDAAIATLNREDKRKALRESAGTFIAFLPTRLTGVEFTLLEALAGGSCSVDVIVGLTGNDEADEHVRQLVARLGGDPIEAEAVVPDEVHIDELLDVSDQDEEVRHVVRRVLADLHSGVSASDICVFLPSYTPYGSILADHLEAAGLAWNGISTQTLAESVAGRFVMGLLDLVESDLPRQAVMNLLSLGLHGRPPQQREDEVPSDGKKDKDWQGWIPLAWWERLVREARVVRGDDWTKGMEAYAEEYGQRIARRKKEEDAVEGDEQDQASASNSNETECAAIAEFMDDLKKRLNEANSANGWSEISKWLEKQMSHYLPKSLSGANAAYFGDDPLRRTQAQASVRVRGIVRELARLDDAQFEASVRAFKDTLGSRFQETVSSQPAGGAGIHVTLTEHGATLMSKRAYILGLVEGIYPSRMSPGDLLGDKDRAVADRQLLRIADRVTAQHYSLLATINATKSNSDGKVVGSAPRGSLRRTTEHALSRWFPKLDDKKKDKQKRSYTLMTVPSFRKGVQSAEFPATEWERDAGDILLTGWDQWKKDNKKRLDANQPLQAARQLTEARESNDFTRFDGNLEAVLKEGHQLGHECCDDATSATQLQTWAKCPRSYLFQYLLGVRAVDDADLKLEMSPLDYGSLVHEALEEISNSFANKGGAAAPSWDEYVDTYMTSPAVCYKTYFGHEKLWRITKRQMRDDLTKLNAKLEKREPKFDAMPTFVAAEAEFDALEYPVDPALASSDGKVVRFKGKIDRIERTPDGKYIVTDYKTGKTTNYTKMEEDPLVRGTALQLPIYAWALKSGSVDLESGSVDLENGSVDGMKQNSLTVSHGLYWFVSTAKGKWHTRSIEFEDWVWNRFDEVINHITNGVASGVFIAKPPANDHDGARCGACDPDGLGTSELRSAYDRKTAACQNDALAPVLALEPHPEETTANE